MSGFVRMLVVAASLFPAAVPAASQPSVMDVALLESDAGTFYVKGTIQGYGEVDLLVDTGSSYLVISEAILARLKAAGHATFQRELKGIMADGTQRITSVYRLSSLRLGASCWVHDIEAAVIPGSRRAILGMNVLEQLSPFTFSANPPHLGLNHCQPSTASAAEVGYP